MNDSGNTTSHTDSAQTFGPDPGRQARIRQLEDRITELTAHIDAATWRWLELVREYDQSGAWAGPICAWCALLVKRVVRPVHVLPFPCSR